MKNMSSEKFVMGLYRKYEAGMTLRELEPIAEMSYGGIRFLFRKFNLKLRARSRKAKIYTTKLRSIVRPEDAYWLGFICGDGYISDKRFAIYLQRNDKEHLLSLRSYLGVSEAIKHNKKTDCFGFEFSSVLWYPYVSSLGLVYLKKNRFLPELSPELVVHFWRGLFDADGGIYARQFCISFSGPELYVNEFRKWVGLSGRCGREFAGTLIQKTPTSFEVKYGGKYNSLFILEKLYGNSTLHLDRKYARYLHYKKYQHLHAAEFAML